MRPDEIRDRFQSTTKGQAVLGIVFGLVFFGIGISVMVFLWTDNGFGAPPLFFRIFATLIAIPFVAVGGFSAYGSVQLLRGHDAAAGRVGALLNRLSNTKTSDEQGAPSQTRVSYACPACGAPLAHGADISPHGDVKCPHCGGWFNVYKSMT